MDYTLPSFPSHNLPAWLQEALGLHRDLSGGQGCSKDLQVFVHNTTHEIRLIPTFCRKRTCPRCSAHTAHERIHRMASVLDRIKSPTHVTLTVPNSGCRAGCLASWVDRLLAARKLFLRKGAKHRSLGTVPVLDWFIWKVEITWSTDNAWWHPHLHVLADGWIRPPCPTPLWDSNIRTTRANIASFWRLRWADCLRKAGLPTPRYKHEWQPGDWAPKSLSNLVKITGWDPSVTDPQTALRELAKYVTKPEVLKSFSPSLEKEYSEALGIHPHQRRTWQPRKGWLPKQEKGSGEFAFVGTLGHMLNMDIEGPREFDRRLAEEIMTTWKENAHAQPNT